MGEIVTITGQQMAQAILGSCLGIALYDPANEVGTLAHVVLPCSEGRTGPPGKFADTAIASMLESLAHQGARASQLICKLAGGASMFANNGPMQIGLQNIAAARHALDRAGIRVSAEHLEGSKGRRIRFFASTGAVEVEVAGMPKETL